FSAIPVSAMAIGVTPSRSAKKNSCARTKARMVHDIGIGLRPSLVDVQRGELKVRHFLARLAEAAKALVDRNVIQRRALQSRIDLAGLQHLPARQDRANRTYFVIAGIMQAARGEELHHQRRATSLDGGDADGLAAEILNIFDILAGDQRERQPVDVAADDLEKAAGLAVENNMLGDPITDLRAPVAQPVGHLVDSLIELDCNIKALVGEHALTLRDPDRQVEIVPRDRGEDQLVHFTCAVNAESSSYPII